MIEIIKFLIGTINDAVDDAAHKVFLYIAPVSIILIMPLWYIGIFLFSHNFYATNDIWMPIVVSLALSVIWYFLNLAIAAIARDSNSVEKEDKKDIATNILVAGGYFSIMKLSKFLFVAYVINKFICKKILITFPLFCCATIPIFIAFHTFTTLFMKPKKHK